MQDNSKLPIGFLSDERVLWHGNPVPNKSLKNAEKTFLIFGGAILLLTLILILIKEIKVVLIGCLPIIIICLVTAGVYFFLEYRRQQTFFIVTDRRIIRSEGIFSKKLYDVKYRQVQNVVLKYNSRSRLGEIMIKLNGVKFNKENPDEIRFGTIENVVTVYNLIQKQLSEYKGKV
ncbi:MAG: PH domain-containing protein [Oscillospiraceae bacterium]|nr:PH domain-containing protein [Oscillospiraceae bacterium]